MVHLGKGLGVVGLFGEDHNLQDSLVKLSVRHVLLLGGEGDAQRLWQGWNGMASWRDIRAMSRRANPETLECARLGLGWHRG